MNGYLAILLYALVLAGIYGFQKRRVSTADGRRFLFFNEQAGTPVLTCNIFNSWFWATSVIGAAEASYLYGISGGLAYVFGASVGFALMILVIFNVNRLMGEPSFLTAYVRGRFSPGTQRLFFAFAILVSIYIMVEQAVGVGMVFSSVFGTSFKKIAFLSLVIAVVFVIKGGLRAILVNDVLNFIVIAALFGGMFGYIAFFPLDGGLAPAAGLPGGAKEHFLDLASVGALRYFLVAILVGFAQSVMDQGYWLKGFAAKDGRTHIKALVFGGLLVWIPITLCCSLVFGYMVYASPEQPEPGAGIGQVLMKSALGEGFGPVMTAVFAVAILCVVMTTIINSLMGVMSLAARDIYPAQIHEGGSDRDALRFSRIFTVLTAAFCGLIALSLENISLLSIDTFSGIFFAAPCATIAAGLLYRKRTGNHGIPATLLGILTGLSVWLYLTDPDIDGLVGTLVSFLVPLLYLGVLELFVSARFSPRSLRM